MQPSRRQARRDFDQAARRAAEAVRLQPANNAYRLLLITSLANAGLLAEADAAATEALARDPPDWAVLVERGTIRWRQNRARDAADDFEAALKLGVPEGRARSVRLALADAAAKAGQPQRVLDALGALRRRTELCVAARRGFALLALGQNDEALAAFDAALATAAPGREHDIVTAAKIGVLANLGRRREAVDLFGQSLANDALSTLPDLDIAYLGVRLGNDEVARDRFAKAQSNGDAYTLGGTRRRLRLQAAGRERAGPRLFPRRHRRRRRRHLAHAGAEPVLYPPRRRRARAPLGRATRPSPTTPWAWRLPRCSLRRRRRATCCKPASRPIGGRRSSVTATAGSSSCSPAPFRPWPTQAAVPTGTSTQQGMVGARWKPFSNVNLIVEGARLFALGTVRPATTGWPASQPRTAKAPICASSRRTGRCGRSTASTTTIFVTPQNLIAFEGRLGRSFRADTVSDHLVGTPFLVAGRRLRRHAGHAGRCGRSAPGSASVTGSARTSTQPRDPMST